MRFSEITPAALHLTASVTAPKNGASRIDLRNDRRARFSRSGAVKGSRCVFLTVVFRRRVQPCLARQYLALGISEWSNALTLWQTDMRIRFALPRRYQL